MDEEERDRLSRPLDEEQLDRIMRLPKSNCICTMKVRHRRHSSKGWQKKNPSIWMVSSSPMAAMPSAISCIS